jgi:dTDP-4-amino-4,6-dideoxygalactose transaminase
MNLQFVDLTAQDEPIRDELERAVQGVLRRGDYILGADVAAFEGEFARYCGSVHAVGVGSGLAALELILRGYGIGERDEVIVPAHTFVGSASAVAIAGATPVLVDVLEDGTIDPERAAAAVTERTRAIMAVHLYGRVAEMTALRELASAHGLKLIEDAAQAHGARYRGQRTGTLGDAAAFSFYPSKNLGAAGDAGIVTTDDGDLADRIRALRNCGQYEKNLHEALPLNHRLDTLQAAVLRVRLTRLDANNAARQRVAGLYARALAASPLALPPQDGDERSSVWHLYVVRTTGREALQAHLADHGVPTAVHYPLPVHLQPAFRDLPHARGDFPVAERLAATVLSLPMHPGVSEEGVAWVAEAVGRYQDTKAA